MRDRQIAIHPAHAGAFAWVFGDGIVTTLINWLRSNDTQLYWISEKSRVGWRRRR